MNRIPKGCSNIGGAIAANMEYCRGAAMHLFSLYGYHPFSPAEFQLVEDVWSNLSPARARRLIPLMSPLGEPCVLRGDLTLSAVAYLGSHHTRSERPLRLSYADRIFSVPQPPKDNLEENQVGVELIGWENAGADAETASLLLRTLDALNIENSALVLGDVSVLSTIFGGLPRDMSDKLVETLKNGDYTEYRAAAAEASLPEGRLKLLHALPRLKGGCEVIDEAAALLGDSEPFAPLRRLCSSLSKLGYSQRLRVDLGFVRDLGYYSGPVYNAYSSADGTLLGGGGRYDGLLAKEGIEGQAAGFALNLKELASHCASPAPTPQLMLWGGGCDCAEVLRYADALSKKERSFELSWAKDMTESLSTARLRGYKWWIDFSGRRALSLPSGRELSLNEFEAEVLSC
ncbi:MAG: ATP phosphoribosyltransferase regulatory subunit [Synergistaceae bacterium]|nr:ATP phosphoribosyltransferase regulatory subunit [Synergistaceae bacterium]